MAAYTASKGQTITDVVMAATGNIINWDLILSANSIYTWVPLFNGGEVVIIPDGVITDANNMRGLNINPPTNNAYNIYSKINAVFAMFP